MKNITIFKLKYCGYCRRALEYVEEIKALHPEYNNLTITLIDEGDQYQIAKKYDYFYVPTFYIDEQKVHEGAVTSEQVQDILKRAFES